MFRGPGLLVCDRMKNTILLLYVYIPILIVILCISTFVGTSMYLDSLYPSEESVNHEPVSVDATESLSRDDVPKATGLQTYSDADLSFAYNPLLSVSRTEKGIMVRHDINHVHQDVCDGKGDAPAKTTLTDFDLLLTVADKNVRDSLESAGWDWESAVPSTLGPLSGYMVSAGTEGCGGDFYFLALSPQKTLVLTRRWVPEFNSINPEYQTYLALPGVISPADADRYFLEIMSSLRFKTS